MSIPVVLIYTCKNPSIVMICMPQSKILDIVFSRFPTNSDFALNHSQN